MNLCIREVDTRVGLLPGEEVLALSVMQPWAACMLDVEGAPGDYKDVENRAFKRVLPRGGAWFAIHAPKLEDDGAARVIAQRLPEVHRQISRGGLPHSSVLGAVHVIAWDSLGNLTADPAYRWLAHSVWATGPYCAVIDQRVKLDLPLPCAGGRGLWHMPSPILRQILRATGNTAAAERMPAPAHESAWGPVSDCRERL